MTRLRYDTSGSWFKGNTHVHSTASDGGLTRQDLARRYAAAGYSFIFHTDHWTTAPAAELALSPLLQLAGMELDGHDHTGTLFHVVCLGQLAEIRRENGFVASLRSVRDQGALLILAHPHWCDNTMDDVLRWPFDGVEIYNHVCHWDNGKSSGLAHWNAALNRRSQALGFAADDTHLTQEHPGWNGGWIMVNARECTAPGIMDAIRRGNYYSSQGPEFYEISLSENELQLRFSPARFIRLVGPGPAGMRRGTYAGDLLTETRFTLPNEWRYLYAEIEDEHGHRAWTNHLLVQPE